MKIIINTLSTSSKGTDRKNNRTSQFGKPGENKKGRLQADSLLAILYPLVRPEVLFVIKDLVLDIFPFQQVQNRVLDINVDEIITGVING